MESSTPLHTHTQFLACFLQTVSPCLVSVPSSSVSWEGAVFVSILDDECHVEEIEGVTEEHESTWEGFLQVRWGWESWVLGPNALTCLVKTPFAHIPEPDVTIVRGLVDTEVQADEEAEFSCEVARAGAMDVEWRLQGLPLQTNEVTEVAVQGGCIHTLKLKSVTPEDAGTVSFHVGLHTSTAQLTVRGSGN